ncbi:GRAM domain family protein [Wolffia australiana]
MAEGTQQPHPAAPSAEASWGTKRMGAPAAPSAHPQNQQMAAAVPAHDDVPPPYLLHPTPADKSSSRPVDNIVDFFSSWAHRTETLATNVWCNLNAAPSKTQAAWGKLGLAAKAVTEGGFEPLFKRIFPVDPNERLKKTFACYLSTTTGPVAGTIYLSTHNLAFCSDRPLSFAAPSGQENWSYYKVVIPLARIAAVSPVTMKETPPERYIQIGTVDGHEFWFMGFVNYEKAATHLLDAVCNFAAHAPGRQIQP